MIDRPCIIAPDSSHWSLWLDAMRSPEPDVRQRATSLHGRLMEQGCVPLLSWHHLEELLGGKDDECAAARVANLQAMPFMAWLRLPHAKEGIGSIVDILAAEVMAACEGHNDLVAVRDRARSLLLMTTAIIALAPPIETFRKGRDFAAWLGLAPRQHSTGGKQRLGSISAV